MLQLTEDLPVSGRSPWRCWCCMPMMPASTCKCSQWLLCQTSPRTLQPGSPRLTGRKQQRTWAAVLQESWLTQTSSAPSEHTDWFVHTHWTLIEFHQSSPLPWPLDSGAIIWGCSLVFIYRLDLLLLYWTSLYCIIQPQSQKRHTL